MKNNNIRTNGNKRIWFTVGSSEGTAVALITILLAVGFVASPAARRDGTTHDDGETIRFSPPPPPIDTRVVLFVVPADLIHITYIYSAPTVSANY